MSFDPKIGGTATGALGAPEASAAVPDASTWLDLNSLSQLKAGANDGRARETLKAVAQQFESLFLGMMLKSMRDAKLGDSPFESDETRFYQDMFDKQISLSLAQGRGLGIAQMLERQLGGRVAPDARSNGVEGPAVSGAGGAAALPGAPAAGATHGFTMPIRGSSAWLPSTTALAMRAAGGGADLPATEWPDASAGFAPAMELAGGALPAPQAGAAPAVPDAAFAGSPEDFVRKVLPHAERAAAALGTDPLVIVAQAALETGWGRRVPATADGAGFNLFGVKAGGSWQGRQLLRDTLEVADGVPVRTRAAFRAYESVGASFDDYVSLIRNSGRYAGALEAGPDADAYATALQSAGYATDPEYARKILAIAGSDRLRDAVAALKEAAAVPTP